MPRGHRVRPGRRRSRSGSGYALVLLIAVLALVAMLAAVLVPDLVRQAMRDRWANETERLRRLSEGLLSSIEQTQTIPGAANWVGAIALESGLNTNEVSHVYAEFPSDTNTARAYLIHPSFTPGTGAGRLPYTQASVGLTWGSTNAPGTNSRVMIVSSIRRELGLPVSSGIPSAAAFEAIWDWQYDPVTKSPPASWPAAWNGKGDGLKVARISLANAFHTLTLNHLYYTLNGSSPAENISSQVQRQFLRGSLMQLFKANGSPYANIVINKDAIYDLPATLAGPVLHYYMNETSGTTATNSGSAGATANGTYTSGPTLAQAGPRPPTFPDYPAGNNAVSFDGNNDYVESAYHMPTTLPQFTLAAWVFPTANLGANTGIIGERDIVFIKSQGANTLRLDTGNGSGTFLDVTWSYANNEWHHIAATGDGTAIRVYLDGVEAGNVSDMTSNYGEGSSTTPFRIGGQINVDSKFSKMWIDQVVFYTRALGASEVSQLYSGALP